MKKVQAETLERIAAVIEQRRGGDPESSYVARLLGPDADAALKKIGEEATETILAAKDAEQSGELRELIGETADLWFHSLVMLSHLGSSHEAVLEELARRFGLSGLEEKASRRKD